MGDLAGRFGRRRVLWIARRRSSLAGVAATLPDNLPAIDSRRRLDHHGASSAPIRSPRAGSACARETARAQASALYLFFYYLGSSVAGSAGGLFCARGGWPGVAALVGGLGLAALASPGGSRSVPAAAPSRRALTKRSDGMARRRHRHRPQAARRILRDRRGDDPRAWPPSRPRARRALGARLQAALQPGNTLGLVWRARLDEHLGAFAVEPLTLRAGRLIASATRARRPRLSRRAAAPAAGARSARAAVRGAGDRRRSSRRRDGRSGPGCALRNGRPRRTRLPARSGALRIDRVARGSHLCLAEIGPRGQRGGGRAMARPAAARSRPFCAPRRRKIRRRPAISPTPSASPVSFSRATYSPRAACRCPMRGAPSSPRRRKTGPAAARPGPDPAWRRRPSREIACFAGARALRGRSAPPGAPGRERRSPGDQAAARSRIPFNRYGRFRAGSWRRASCAAAAAGRRRGAAAVARRPIARAPESWRRKTERKWT